MHGNKSLGGDVHANKIKTLDDALPIPRSTGLHGTEALLFSFCLFFLRREPRGNVNIHPRRFVHARHSAMRFAYWQVRFESHDRHTGCLERTDLLLETIQFCSTRCCKKIAIIRRTINGRRIRATHGNYVRTLQVTSSEKENRKNSLPVCTLNKKIVSASKLKLL